MSDVSESFSHCRKVARRRARNFYYSFLLLPAEKREAMCALYAFMRYADDISDETAPPLAVRRERLGAWRQALEAALEGHYGDDLILPAFHQTVQRYSIPPHYFFELMDGVGRDLQEARFGNFDELYRYCYQVASVVGITTIHVFGFESPEAPRLAEKCGVAFQLTNILRDVAEDARSGRLYLPEEDLQRFGLSADDVMAGRTGAQFREFMQFQWDRANRYYQEAAPLLGMVGRESRAALWAMMAIYHRILRRIRRTDFDVYNQRASLNGWEKSWIVLRALQWRFDRRAPDAAAALSLDVTAT